jgi:peroxiredoxin
VIVLDSTNIVRYTEMVSAIENEPDYDAALAALRTL